MANEAKTIFCPILRSTARLVLLAILASGPPLTRASETTESTKESAVERLLREDDDFRQEVDKSTASMSEWLVNLRRDSNPQMREYVTGEFDALLRGLEEQADELAATADYGARPRDTAVMVLTARRVITQLEQALPEIVLEDAVERLRPEVTAIRKRMDDAATRAARRVLETPPYVASLDASTPSAERLTASLRERADWSQYRGAADRNNYRIDSTPPKRPEVLWSHPAVNTPAVVGDIVYAPGATLQMLALRTGKTLGESPIAGSSTPVVTARSVIVSSSQGVFALRRDLQAERWSVRGIAPSPTLHAAMSGGTYVIVLDSGEVLALDTEDGAERWRTRLDDDTKRRSFVQGIQCSPAIANGRVYIGSTSGRFLALDLESGEEVWRYDGEHAFGWTNPVAAFGKVFVGDRGGFIHAFDSTSGREIWKRVTGSTGLSEPGVLPGSIVVGHANILTIFDEATGRTDARRFTSGLNPLGSPTVIGDAVLFGCLDGNFYAFDFATEQQRFRLETEDEVQVKDFVFHRGVLLVSTSAGLFALADPKVNPERSPKTPHIVELRS